VGKERELTYIDILGEAETVKKPIKRLANLGYNGVEMTRTLGAVDMVVAVGSDRSAHSTFFPKISKLPAVGTVPDCDFEKILSLEPDAVQTNIEAGWALLKGPENKRMFKEKLPGMPLISLNMREPDVLVRNVRTYGYIIDREDEAEEFIDWFEDLYLNTFKARIDGLSEDKKPKAYFEYTPYYCYASGSRLGQVLVGAGGNNIIDEIVGPDHPNYGGMLDVEREFIVKENPDFIFKAVGSWISGYDIDNPSEIAAKRQQVLDRPELVNANAVKNKRVYSVSFWILGGAGQTMAKLFHPDLFEDMDPQAIHQEYLDRFCRIDFNVKEHGTFVYPSYEEWPAI
jgi:iron complex transport system substrate-binding protein